MHDSEFNYQNCIRCGIARGPDCLDSKGVCEFCKPPMQQVHGDDYDPPEYRHCSDCGAELYDFFHGDNQLCEVCGGY